MTTDYNKDWTLEIEPDSEIPKLGCCTLSQKTDHYNIVINYHLAASGIKLEVCKETENDSRPKLVKRWQVLKATPSGNATEDIKQHVIPAALAEINKEATKQAAELQQKLDQILRLKQQTEKL